MADVKFVIEFSSNGVPVIREITGEAGRMGDSVERSGARAANGFSKLQASVISVNQAFDLASRGLNILTSLFDRTAGQTLAQGDAYAKMAQKVGVSVESLSSLALAADLSDVSIEQLGDGLRFLNRNVTEAQDANSEAGKAFRALGVDATDASGKLRATDAILLEVADAFAGAEDNAAKTAIAMAIFGRSGADLIPLLNQGSDAIKEQQAQAQALGLTFTGESAKGAERFNDSINLLGKTIYGTLNQAIQSILPELATGAEETLAWVQANKDFIASGITDTLKSAVQYAKDFTPEARSIASILGGLLSAYTALPGPVQQAGIVGILIGGKAGLAIGGVLAALSALNNLTQETFDNVVGAADGADQYRKSLDALKNAANEAGASNFQLLSSLNTGTGQFTVYREGVDATHRALLNFGAGETEAEKAIRKKAKAQAEARAAIEGEIAIHKEFQAGLITEAELQKRLAAARNEDKLGSQALAATYAEVVAKSKDLADAQKLIDNNSRELAKTLEQERKANEANVVTITLVTDALTEETAIITAGLAARKPLEAIERELADARRARAKATELAAAEESGLTAAEREAIEAKYAALAANDAARASMDAYSRSLSGGVNAVNVFEDALRGLAQGTLKEIPDIFAQAGKAALVKFASSFLFGKGQAFDIPFQANVLGLVGNNGLIGNLFRIGGQGAAQQFGGNFLSSLFGGNPLSAFSVFRQGGVLGGLGGPGGLFGQTLPPGVFGPPAPGFFQPGSGLFGGSGFGGAGALAGLGGAFFGSGSDVSRGISGGLGAAALIPGPQQPFVAAAAILASLFAGDAFGLNKPGRIQLEKESLEDLFESVLGPGFKVVKEKQGAAGLKAFEPLQPAGLFLGGLFADQAKEGNQGSIVRTAAQLFGNLDACVFQRCRAVRPGEGEQSLQAWRTA